MAIPLTSDASSAPPPEGRPAVQELAELLLLRRRPAVVAVVAVLLLGSGLAALGLVPTGVLAGLVVGLVALVAAFAAMLAADAADPVVRGPRHVRVTGRTVVGRVDAVPTPAQVGTVVDGIVKALTAVRRLRMTVVGVEQDTSEVARLVAEGVAAAGRTVLLVDLTTGRDRPGVTNVSAGTHRLGDVVRLEPGLQLAVTGAGTAGNVPAAAARLAATPPSDLDLLLTVLPRDERPGSGLLAGTDRVLALVPLGVLERHEVAHQLAMLEQARSTRAAVVVVDPSPLAADRRQDATGSEAAPDSAVAPEATAPPDSAVEPEVAAPPDVAVEPEDEDAVAVEDAPEDESIVAGEPEAPEAREAPEGEPQETSEGEPRDEPEPVLETDDEDEDDLGDADDTADVSGETGRDAQATPATVSGAAVRRSDTQDRPATSGADLSVGRDHDDHDDLLTTAALEVLAAERAHGE